MADYIHEQCVETGVERSFFLCVLDGALRSSFPFLEEKMPWISCIWCSCHILSLFFKDCFSTGSPSKDILRKALYWSDPSSETDHWRQARARAWASGS
jgi:hypothetical protein